MALHVCAPTVREVSSAALRHFGNDSPTVCERSEEGAPSCWARGTVLGRGSFGRVHHTMDRQSCAMFAVKTVSIPPEAASDPTTPSARASMAELSALKNEIIILQRLEGSPYVVRYLGDDWIVGSDGSGERNLFLELANGGSLADFSRRFGGRLEESMIQRFCQGILRGLEHVHSRGVVHADVKGQNVLSTVDQQGAVSAKLSGFADDHRQTSSAHCECASREASGACAGRPGRLTGTVQWMAPEVARQSGPLGPASDIWSLGCTVIEMATGRAPWSDGEDTMSTLFRIACSNEVPAFPPHLSTDAQDFLSKCLVRELCSRWSSSQLLKHPFVASDGDDTLSCDCRRRSFGDHVMANSNLGFVSDLTSNPDEGRSMTSPIREEVEAAMGEEDAVEEGRVLWQGYRREQLTCGSPGLKVAQRGSRRLVFDLPTAADRDEGAGSSFYQYDDLLEAIDDNVDNLGWDCGRDERGVSRAALVSHPTELQDGGLEGNLSRPGDGGTADEGLPLQVDAVCPLSKPLAVLCARRRKRRTSDDDDLDAGAADNRARAGKLDQRSWRQTSVGLLSQQRPLGRWVGVVRDRKKHARAGRMGGGVSKQLTMGVDAMGRFAS